MEELSEQDFHFQVNQITKKSSVIPIFIPVSTRLAFSAAGLFVNGECYVVSELFAESVCDGEIAAENMSESEKLVLITLLELGDVSLF